MDVSTLSDDALLKIIYAANSTAKTTKVSTDDVFERLSKLNDLLSGLTTKPEGAALIYRDASSGAIAWKAVGERLVVGRSPKLDQDSNGSVLQMDDEELSRRHFEIVHGGEGVYVINDLNSTNGLFINDSEEKSAFLVAGTEIRAGRTNFIFVR